MGPPVSRTNRRTGEAAGLAGRVCSAWMKFSSIAAGLSLSGPQLTESALGRTCIVISYFGDRADLASPKNTIIA